MANDFSSDSSCAALWRFESGGLSTDSKGSNTLTLVNSPTEDTVNYKEGGCSINLAASSQQCAYIPDSSLSSDFPLKSGDTTKQITVACWIRPTTLDLNDRHIWAKFRPSGNQRTLQFYHYNSTLYLRYSWNGVNDSWIQLGSGSMTSGRWYHCVLAVDGINKFWRLVFYDAYNGTVKYLYGTLAYELYISTADFRIGNDDALGSSNYFNGNIDEVVVFNRILSQPEMYAIRGGQFPCSGNIWYVNPASGSDSNTGVSWSSAFKTLRQYFDGDCEIRIAKSSETSLSGTVTTTNKSEIVTTTNDLTGSLTKYSFVRIGDDDDVYMVWAVTSSQITLCDAYRGSSGSGKAIKSLTGFKKSSTNDWRPLWQNSSSSRPIKIVGGYNTSTDIRDGFTIIDWENTSAYVFGETHNYWDFSYILIYYVGGYEAFYKLTDCSLTKCGTFRIGSSARSIYFATRCNFVDCLNSNFKIGHALDSKFTNLYTGNPEGSALVFSGGNVCNVTVTNWKNAGWNAASYYFALAFEDARLINCQFINTEFDVLGKGCVNFGTGNYSAQFNNVCFFNPKLSSGTLFRKYGSSFYQLGEIGFVNVGNDSASHFRLLFPSSTSSDHFPVKVSPDYSIFQSAAPSVKVELNEWECPIAISHCVPCNMNEEVTISAYLRKNSSYGSSNLPKMCLNWLDSTSAFCTAQVTMSDVTDTWDQVTYTLTPGVTGVINVDFVFQSAVSGAIVWYDDLKAT